MRHLAIISVICQWLCLPVLADPARIVAYEIVNGREIPAPLSEEIADAELGRQIYLDPDLGDCASCHGTRGDIRGSAPDLTNLVDRMTAGETRLWIAAPEVIGPDLSMPAYYAAGQRDDPKDPRFGEPRLSAQEIENIIAYLSRTITPQ